MIIGIFSLLVLGCFLLLYSSERKLKAKQENEKRLTKIEETNAELDNMLEQLEEMNPILEKICNQIEKFNHKFLKTK